MSVLRSTALAGFAIRTNLRSATTVGGMAAFAGIAALGPAASLKNGQGWTVDPDFLFYGYLIGALFALRSGIEQQRENGLQTYLRHNFASPLEHAFGAVLSLLGTWLLLTTLLFLLAFLCSAGDGASAAWYASTYGLALALLLPFVLMVESVSALRIPLLLPVIGYLALAVILSLTVGEERMAALLWLSVERGDLGGLVRLALRVGWMVPTGMALFLAAVHVRGRRPAFAAVVPSRH